MSIIITPLSEGVFTIGANKIFVPYDPSTSETELKSGSVLKVEIQPFLIETNHKKILFDTGLGYRLPNGELQIHDNLRRKGIDPKQIDMVILSHLHKDHAGGVSQSNSLGIQELSFSNAIYYVGRKEFEYGIEKSYSTHLHGPRSYEAEDFELLKNSNQLEWLEEAGNIQQFISYEIDGGHCPYHMSFLVNDDSAMVFYGGDVVPQLKQLKTKYIAKYDFDGRRSMELRQTYAMKGKEEDWTFLFYHDVQMPYSKL